MRGDINNLMVLEEIRDLNGSILRTLESIVKMVEDIDYIKNDLVEIKASIRSIINDHNDRLGNSKNSTTFSKCA